ncbi:MAG: DsbA family protein [Polyangiaceae bacterium]
MTTRAVRFIAAIAFAVLGGACHGGVADDASKPGADVDLPGVDTHDFTPRERREFSRYVTELASPCAASAGSIAQCVLEKRACPECGAAATVIARAVREGMSPGQVHDLYVQRFDASSVKKIPLDGSPSRGPASAPVTLVEFADFECPFCQRIAPELDALWTKRSASVRMVYKFMPLPMHPHGEIAARAAIAADAQGKFWEMDRLLFAGGDHLESADLEAYAHTLGLDIARFRADMRSPATQARLDTDHKLADALGVKGTPTLYINGREYDANIDINDWVDGEIAASKPR